MSTNEMCVTATAPPAVASSQQYRVSLHSGAESEESLAWNQIAGILAESLTQSGFPQPDILPQGSDFTPPRLTPMVVVAPGVAVSLGDFEKRYACLDLADYKTRMTPELFRAFVRHIGRIPGSPDLELGDVVTPHE